VACVPTGGSAPPRDFASSRPLLTNLGPPSTRPSAGSSFGRLPSKGLPSALRLLGGSRYLSSRVALPGACRRRLTSALVGHVGT